MAAFQLCHMHMPSWWSLQICVQCKHNTHYGASTHRSSSQIMLHVWAQGLNVLCMLAGGVCCGSYYCYYCWSVRGAMVQLSAWPVMAEWLAQYIRVIRQPLMRPVSDDSEQCVACSLHFKIPDGVSFNLVFCYVLHWVWCSSTPQHLCTCIWLLVPNRTLCIYEASSGVLDAPCCFFPVFNYAAPSARKRVPTRFVCKTE